MKPGLKPAMRFSGTAVLRIPSSGMLIGMLWLLGYGPVYAEASSSKLTRRWADQVLQSFYSHPQLLAGQAAREMANAKINTARQPIYEPQIGFEWKQRGRQSAGSNFEIFVAQKLDIAGKSEARVRVSESEHEASREEYRLIQQKLLQSIMNSLIARWKSAQFLGIAKRLRAQVRDFVQLLEKHKNAGRLSAYEVDNGYLKLADIVRMLAEAEEVHLQSEFKLASLIGDSSIPDHLPSESIGQMPEIDDIEKKIGSLASVAAARWRFESSRAGLEAVETERLLDPTVGLIGGKDESDNFIGVAVAVPLALRSSSEHFREVSSQAALINEQKYLESFRIAESRLRHAGTIYRSVLERWEEWRSLTADRLGNREGLLRRLWDSGEISSADYLTMLRERADAAVSGVRLNARVWIARTELLAASGELEFWLRNLAGYGKLEIGQ